MAKIDSIHDLSDKALVELKAWMEPWWQQKARGRLLTTGTTPGSTFSDAMTALGATASLLAWWRLGEAAGPTFADSNSYLSHCDLTQQVTGTALTANITGALPSSQDDGAVRFNSPGSGGDYLTSGCGARFNLNSTNFSVAAWINPTSTVSTFLGQIAGAYGIGTSTALGWVLTFDYPGMTVNFTRQQDGGSTATVTGPSAGAGEWSFVVGTYSTTNGLSLYVNGVLVDSDATTFNHGGPSLGVGVGARSSGAAPFYGGIDEVSVWGSTLAAADIMGLYLAGLASTAPSIGIQLSAGESFTVLDSSGNPIFRVDEDGDLHGKTGKALTFDL